MSKPTPDSPSDRPSSKGDVAHRDAPAPELSSQETAFAASLDGMAILDASQRYTFLNEAHARIYGYDSARQLIGSSWRALYDEAELSRFDREIMPVLTREGRWQGEAVGRRRDGTRFPQELSLTVLEGGGVVCVVRDVSERERAERALRESEERYRTILESIQEGYYEVDLGGNFTFVNEALARFLGYTREQLIGANDREYTDAENAKKLFELFSEVHATGQTGSTEFELIRKDGSRRFVSASVALIRDEQGRAVGFRGVGSDITERKRAADALRESEARFRAVAEAAPGGIFIFRGSKFHYANDAMALISGYSRAELLQMDFWQAIHPDLREEVRARGFARQRGEAVPSRYELRILRKDGTDCWVETSVAPIELGGKPAVLGTAFDITERKLKEEQIKRLAYQDPLTGLPNRRLLGDRLSVAIAQAHRTSQRVAVLFMDLDNFKTVNDALGHDLGDQLLKGVAERLAGAVREGDTVARLAGDEFTLLIPGALRALDAVKVADKILESLRQPFQLADHQVRVTGSIGIAIYPDDGDDAESLLRNADAAMYRAKQQGRDNYQLCTSSLNETALGRIELERHLREALEREELELHYRPIAEQRGKGLRGFEAHLRWRHREQGLLPPARFGTIAEVAGLIGPIGAWQLRAACKQLKAWQAQPGRSGLSVGIRISPRQLQQPDLAGDVLAVLEASRLAPASLELWLTHSAVLHNEQAAETLRKLAAQGVRVGVSSLPMASMDELKHLPVQALKLDPSFVQRIAEAPEEEAIVAAIITLAHSLGMGVIADGVATEQQRSVLAAQGCDGMQGPLFGLPAPPGDCAALLASP